MAAVGLQKHEVARSPQKRGPSDTYIDDEACGSLPPPTSSSYQPDYAAIQAEMEEMQFREKAREALEDDERLDGRDFRFNDYAHVPERWGGSHTGRDKRHALDPRYMNDDECV
ncbi:hypothetical protein BU15DRAFT_72350 [Melanogaster broomeanus]|nr:hypothetical protein BU15DRAFT_72350 [Melanogaster broomeanus]